mgnify:CR=1 FL=1
MAIVTSILFIIAFISYISGALLCPIGKEEQNRPVQGFQTIIYQCIVLMNITAFAAVIFNKVHLPITLLTTSVFILVLSGILWGIIFYKKEKNVIFWSRTDGISMAILIVVIGFISAKMFNFSLEVTYPIQDAANHFKSAMYILRAKRMGVYSFTPYVNATLMELFQPFFSQIQIYKTFILADIIYHVLEILAVYCVFSSISKKNVFQITNLIFSVIYFIGYPYLCFSYGFVRQQRASLLFIGLVCHIIKEKKGIHFYVLVFIQLFNILESYPIYLLQAGLLVGMFFLGVYRKRIYHFLKSNMGKIVAIVCTIMGVVGAYVVYLKFDAAKNSLSEAGGTYFSPYSDLVYFVPPMIFVIVEVLKVKRKGRTNVICACVIISCVAVTIGEFILWWNGVMSSYYYYKAYSLLWFAGWLSCVYAIRILVFVKRRREILFYGSLVIVLCFIQCTGINKILVEKDPYIENGSMRSDYYNLLGENLTQICGKERENYFSHALEDAAIYIKTNNADSKICYMATDKERNTYLWFCTMTDIISYEVPYTSTDMNELKYIGNEWKIDCFLINKKSIFYDNNRDILEKMNCVYQNEETILLQKNGTEW